MAFSSARVTILDYGSGNVRSVYNLFRFVGADVTVENSPEAMKRATHLVLPGVGAFGAAMRRLGECVSLDVLDEEVRSRGKPFLGICVGMQLLANRGEEFGEHEGLGWIPGSVTKLDSGDEPLPHVGWNDLRVAQQHLLFTDFPETLDFYFVHSFVFRPQSDRAILATTSYGETFASAVALDNVLGVQFHPEKSQKVGQLLVRNFLSMS